MKKFLSTLTSFSLIGFNSFNIFACIEQVEEETEKQLIKSDLQVAKQFISSNHLIVDTILANKNTGKYIDYLKNKHQDQIKNEINFLFNENEFEGLVEGEQQVLAILNHHQENATVNIKFSILPDLQVANNILNQTEIKLQQNIRANNILETSTLNQTTIDQIINLINNRISNNDVQVKWISNSSFNTLESNKANKIQIELFIKQEEDDSLLASKIVDVTLVDVSDSQETVNQNLFDTAEQKLALLDGEGLSENDDLSSSELRQKIINLLQTTLNNPQINITLLTENKTLKENHNEIKVKLTIESETTESVERNITVAFLNIITAQKHDNIIYLKEKLPKILSSVDATSLSSEFSIKDSAVWQLINKTINNSNVKAVAPPLLNNNIITIQKQFDIVSNNIRRFAGQSFGREKINPASKLVAKPKVRIKKVTKSKPKVKKSKDVSAKKNTKQDKRNNDKSKDDSNLQTKKDSSQQDDKNEQFQHFQEKMEQAETLSQSFIDQLIDPNNSIKDNDYNIFALVTVGTDENTVTDIVPVKFINVKTNN